MTPKPGPEVTVVIPTRDRWAELTVAGLPAALGQEQVNHEVIVVDDGSADGTSARLAGLDEPRLRVLRNNTPQGVAAARNRGLRDARAPWVAFLDDDDLWSPRKLRAQLAAAASGADFVLAGGVITDPSGLPLRDNPAPAPGTLAEALGRRNVVGGPSAVMARTAVLHRLGGFDERFSLLADWELWIRLAQVGSAAACRETLVAYREHASNMSGIEIDAAYAELAALTERHDLDVDFGEFARWLAWQQRRVGRRLPAVRAYVRGARTAKSGALLLRAAAAPLGEGVMGTPRRLRAILGRPDAAPSSPSWLERYRPGLAPPEPLATHTLVRSAPAPLVSVVIPTHNRGPRAGRAVRMALGQQGVELEVVVVDDGSTDSSRAVLESVRDPRLRVLHNDSPRGVAAARNRGIQAAAGHWIAFLDDDDLWSPEKLRLQLDRAAETGAGFAYAGALRLREPNLVLGVDAPPSPHGLAREMLARNVLPSGPSNVVARADLVRRLGGFDEALDFAADWDLWIRLASRASAAACPELLVGYVEHESNMSASVGDAAMTEFRYLVAKHRSSSEAAGVRFDAASFTRGVAYGHLRAGRRLRAARAYLRGARTGNLGNVARAAAAAVGGPAAQRLSHDKGIPAPDVDWIKQAWPIGTGVGTSDGGR